MRPYSSAQMSAIAVAMPPTTEVIDHSRGGPSKSRLYIALFSSVIQLCWCLICSYSGCSDTVCLGHVLVPSKLDEFGAG